MCNGNSKKEYYLIRVIHRIMTELMSRKMKQNIWIVLLVRIVKDLAVSVWINCLPHWINQRSTINFDEHQSRGESSEANTYDCSLKTFLQCRQVTIFWETYCISRGNWSTKCISQKSCLNIKNIGPGQTLGSSNALQIEQGSLPFW